MSAEGFSGLGFGQAEQPEQLPTLVLAYVGDAVYELAVRSLLVAGGRIKVGKLHQEAVGYVNASAQAEALRVLDGRLTEQETAVVRRGRNAKSAHTPRRTAVMDYRRSTALECLLGYLFLKGDGARLEEILRITLEREKA